jgi:hypothetical protein
VEHAQNYLRYYPDSRYDLNTGLEDSLTDEKCCQSLQNEYLFSENQEAGATALWHYRRESTEIMTTIETND